MAGRFWPIQDFHRKLLAEEQGAVIKEPGGRLNVALLYPNTYNVGLANLGLAVVYDMLNKRQDVLCERAFLPDRSLAALYKKTKAPLLTLESSRPVADFDLILCSISFENDYPNLANMLDMAQLSMDSAKREGPLVIAGGVAVMLNTEPLALMADGFLLGEAEVVLDPFVDNFFKAIGKSKEDFLLSLSQNTRGFYAPCFYEPDYDEKGLLINFSPKKGLPKKIEVPKYQGPTKGLAQSVFKAQGPELADMKLLEVGRGCGHGCRFCAAGHIYRPPRLGKAHEYMDAAIKAAQNGGRIGLVSAAASDLEGIDELASQVIQHGGRLSVSSLRADCMGDDLVKALAQSKHQTVALAPEAGSQRLRRVINKHLTEENLFTGVEKLIQGGVPNIRLYFMIGLPFETEEDVDELISLVKRIRQQVVSLSRAKGFLGRVTISLNAFIPKPFTPFQWEGLAPLKLVKKRITKVKQSLAKLANVKVVNDVPKYAQLQAVLARGDRRLHELIKTLAKDSAPQRAFAKLSLNPDFYAHRTREQDELMPWDFLDHGIKKSYLWHERQKAYKGVESPDCQPEICKRCGVCKPQKTIGS